MVVGAESAADFHGNGKRGGDFGDHFGMCRRAVEGAVEVDDVQRAPSLGLPVARHRNWVVTVDRGVVRHALPQADALATLQVNRGNDCHSQTRCIVAS